MKKAIIITIIFFTVSIGLYSFDIGVLGGNFSNPSHLTYGISGSTGLLVPMLKMELEYFRIQNTEVLEYPNVMTIGIQFRPKIGNLSPYAAVGVGSEFDNFGFDEKFTYIGGGVHLFVTGMFSIRGDIRFMNYSDYNRTRISGGIFLHF